jgi:hypothetical protein
LISESGARLINFYKKIPREILGGGRGIMSPEQVGLHLFERARKALARTSGSPVRHAQGMHALRILKDGAFFYMLSVSEVVELASNLSRRISTDVLFS